MRFLNLQNYKDDISNIHSNEEHLQLLLQKQASVIETSLNVVKIDEVEIARQHSFLNELVHNMIEIEDDAEYFKQFFLAALQMSDECNRLELLLSQLLESVSNLDVKHINLNIISNAELKNQIDIIHKNVEKSLMVPSKNVYGVMQMKPFLTKKNIIFYHYYLSISIKFSKHFQFHLNLTINMWLQSMYLRTL